MTVVGFDFGTTNSLVSVVVGGRVIDVTNGEDGGRPYPSVVKYEGERVVVGREAQASLDAVGIGIHGDVVKSPKFLLGQEVVSVGGVDRSPVDIVSHVVKHVRAESLRSARKEDLGNLDQAVVTIPVTMDGERRAALREAFASAGISITQFVHEPLAALYGFIRSAPDSAEMARRLAKRNVLVVDWGGGTLDLTLCRIDESEIRQLRNGGSDSIGGDEFDKVIRDEVVARFRAQSEIASSDAAIREAELRLLQDAEMHKVELSGEIEKATFYRGGYFESGSALHYSLSRQELDEFTRPLISAGIREIESLLDSLSMAVGQVSMCIVVGGMAAMPAIRARLHAMFGPDRVRVPANSATLISQGAAWIAKDQQRLRLAKPIELELARGSRIPLLAAGTEMPLGGSSSTEVLHLYCADPTDGVAKFPVVTPTALSPKPRASEPRTALGMLAVDVDVTAPPLHERLALKVELDDDLVLSLEASSSRTGDRASDSYFDLEFGLELPSTGLDEALSDPEQQDVRAAEVPTGLVIRANLTDDKKDQAAVPGDVLYEHNSAAFARHARPGVTEDQLTEHLYYQPCAVCKRPWGAPECRCGS